MSTEVYLQSVRKSDYCPFERVYLGSIALKRELLQRLNSQPEATVMGCHVHNIGNFANAMQFISEFRNIIDASNGWANALDNYNPDSDDFIFWVVIEE